MFLSYTDRERELLRSLERHKYLSLEQIARRRERPLLLATAGTIPLAVRVDRPAEVGADRLVNAFAAGRLYGMPAVVVDLAVGDHEAHLSDHRPQPAARVMS